MEMTLCVLVCFFFAMVAGGISESATVEWLSRWEDKAIVRAAIMHKPLPSETLVNLSHRWFVGEEALFFLLRHPNFPQKERSSLIRKGKGIFYVMNITPGHFTKADIEAYLEYSSGWTFFRPEGLIRILQTPGMSECHYRRAWRNFTERYERTELYGWIIPRCMLRKNEIRQCEYYPREFEKVPFLPKDVQREINEQLKLIQAD